MSEVRYLSSGEAIDRLTPCSEEGRPIYAAEPLYVFHLTSDPSGYRDADGFTTVALNKKPDAMTFRVRLRYVSEPTHWQGHEIPPGVWIAPPLGEPTHE